MGAIPTRGAAQFRCRSGGWHMGQYYPKTVNDNMLVVVMI